MTDESKTTEIQHVKEITHAIRRAFERAGYQPTDPFVGMLLRSLLAAHEIMTQEYSLK